MTHQLKPVPNVGGGVGIGASAPPALPAEIPTAPMTLTAAERKVWNHVTQALLDVGLIHRTDALVLAVICRTFSRWVAAEKQLSDYAAAHGGDYMVTTPNGYVQPHQIFHVASKLKKELLQWLPEAALTIPSFQKATAVAAGGGQGSLFEDDPVEQHRQRKIAAGMRAV
ncbi:P27 family phage terminase small subunit [Achromobacter sp. SD115]|uniref:P27 family phage terminase small subunit n=1 Tax=Achromobacter sp. SD115 TaxID=2782011 RepID=UPI001A95ECC4|nr:P27 family phage terminase small subunit [Achromobacter sp. SD115]MBO1012270.1 P27 family phage terminase small subunit [Achromobacter sp. SD115]